MIRHIVIIGQAAAKRQDHFRRGLLPIMIAGCFGYGGASANPVGPQVVNGQAGFSNQGNVLTIINSPGSVINWQGFSIGSGELTRFVQQNSSSSVLNRIVGQDPSQILGALQSNGRVFLINPNGILFGQGAQVDVSGLVASTLNISNEDFAAGRLNFKAGGTAANLMNQGMITTPSGGQVFLIAPNVDNSGIITSPQGDVLLAAGHTVNLADSTNPDVRVVISAPDHQALNLGKMIAEGGRIGIYGALVNQRGVISANSAVVGDGGKIMFKASKDTILDAGSVTTAIGEGKGGDVEILGNRVGLVGGAQVDVSGKTGGGTVLIGGDYHGGNATVQNATRTYVGLGAEIKADALRNGDGGKVIVWSDEVTRNYGDISARGGQQGGDGGFVESSSKQMLEHHARVDVSAPAGKGGTLLLDPATITLVGGPGDGGSDASNTSFQGGATAGTVNFADSDITSAGVSNIFQSELEGLGAGTNIILEATDYINATGTFSNLVTLPSNANLTMRTRNSSSDGSGSIGINLVGSTDSSNLEFKTQGTGTITMQTGTGSSPQFATIDAGKLTTAGGQVTVNASGNVVLRGVTTTPGGGNGGDISITSGGYMTLGGAYIDARGSGGANGNVTLNSGGAISMQTGKTIYGNQLKMTAVNGIYGTSSADAMGTQINSLNASNSGTGTIKIGNSGANLSIADIGTVGYGVRQLAGGQSINLSSSVGETIDISAPISANNGAILLSGISGINLYASTQPEISSNGGPIILYSSNPGAKISTAASTQINSGGGTISLQADKMQLLGTINATSSGIVKLAPLGGTTIDLGTVSTDFGSSLELANSEMSGITAGTLVVGDTGSGAIDIKSSLTSSFPAMSLISGGTITQQTGALMSGSLSFNLQGSSVTLLEANPTGVIAGSTTGGDFQYHSSNGIAVDTVDGQVGISVPNSYNVRLESDHSSGISQSAAIVAGGLALKSVGPVVLTDTGNSFSKLAADLSAGTAGTSTFTLYDSKDLTVDLLSSITGIATNNAPIYLAAGAGKTLTVSQPVSAGTSRVTFASDNLSLGNTVTAGLVDIRPFSSNRTITVGDTTCNVPPCLAVTNLYNVVASTIGIGTTDTSSPAGAIYVAGISQSGASAISDINPTNTQRIGLLSRAGVTQGGAIQVQDLGIDAGGVVNLPLSNTVSNLAGVTPGNFTFANSGSLTIKQLSGGVTPNNYSLNGIASTNGYISLTAGSGDITLTAPVTAGSSTAASSFHALSGSIIPNGGSITATSLQLYAGGDIGSSTSTPLVTSTSTLAAYSSGAANPAGSIYIQNAGTLSIDAVELSSTGSGNINIDNTGAMTLLAPGTKSAVGMVTAGSGSITFTAHSPLSINGSVTSNGGTITLEAGASGSTSDKLTIASGASVSTPGGAVILKAGDAISISGTITAAAITNQAFLNGSTTTSPPPPTIDQCIADPTLTGCSTVLPTLAQCTATPTLAGCTAVLPTLTQCTATPTLAGCTVVLPTLTQCAATPTLAGCTAVLPTLAQCTATSTLAGCTAVLPTLAQCTATPTLAGCSVILPTMSQCAANPLLDGCSAVLPALNQCIVTPTLANCNLVLPSLSQCVLTPALEGCGVVLPTLSQCLTAPTLTGCSAILPALSQCTATPTLAGCDAVLPPVSQCTATPTLPGCTSVSPTTQPPDKKSVNQALNTTINTINVTVLAQTTTSNGAGGGSGSSSSDSGEKKQNGSKDAVATATDSEAKKNDTAPKMYCN